MIGNWMGPVTLNCSFGTCGNGERIRVALGYTHTQYPHFSSHEVQKWTDKNATPWRFHLPYSPTTARLIEG